MFSNRVSLQKLHTFSLPVSAKGVIHASGPEEIISAWQEANQRDLPFLLLGEGSNVLFLEHFNGLVVFNRIKGIDITETETGWNVHVGAGENWHNLVSYLLDKNVPGLENLALIPGCVGSSPIQNIGAYGVELKNVCSYVDLLDLTMRKIKRIYADDCQFGYRESIFKHQYKYGYAIIAVGLILPKAWKPVLNYGDLKRLDPATTTAREIFDTVCRMRRSKLPDPVVAGNAGSFFKNPIVSESAANAILAKHPDAPVYPQKDGSAKLAAGWLIDRCGLKGFSVGGAAVHENQALVIINKNGATSQDIVDLAYLVRRKVAEVFNVLLEPEVRFIDAYGEVNAVEYLS